MVFIVFSFSLLFVDRIFPKFSKIPEGPELAIAAAYIQRACGQKLFSRIIKSDVSKCQNVPWENGMEFSITAQSRGKEIMLHLHLKIPPDVLSSNVGTPTKFILFHFGMSGRFVFSQFSSRPKHAHLTFITSDGTEALNFVDTRRFGKWEVKNAADYWSRDRGPDALFDYENFRKHIADSLEDSAFDRPLCETMLDQRYFNGIGNYLRAEIIFRAAVPPFEKARNVLEKLISTVSEQSAKNEKDVLLLCHTVQKEVLALQGTFYTDPNTYLSDNDKSFDQWLQCYGKSNMNRVRDANKRMMWFSGPAGSLARFSEKSKTVKKRVSKAQKSSPIDTEKSVTKKKRASTKVKLEENSEEKMEMNISKQVIKDELKIDPIVSEFSGMLTRRRTKMLYSKK